VKPGQTADADIDGRTYRLRLTRVYPQVENGVFTAELDFVGPSPPGLVPGAGVQGKLSLGGDEDALVIPAGAFLERTGGGWIFVLDPGGATAHRRDIRVGRRNVEQVEIAAGLKAGEKVITSDYTGYDRIDRIDLVN
jgi:HlyD family secretion protein